MEFCSVSSALFTPLTPFVFARSNRRTLHAEYVSPIRLTGRIGLKNTGFDENQTL
nr:MAG TPA: hypothetical protein [Caudoviricetes sp.]